MFRHDHPRRAGHVPDLELGIAALLLLAVVVLTVAFVPSFA